MTFERLGTMNVNAEGHLEIGGVDTLKLAEKYGTPLYVYDVALIRDRARGFKKTFEELGVKAQVAYASKAFSAVAIYQLMAEEGLSLDVVSGGELYTAIKAGFPAERVHFHGNNKSVEEIHMALDYGIGCFVLDNYYEISLLEDILIERNEKAAVLIRVTPGIEAHTHDYILTGQDDSKFGFGLTNGQAEAAIKQVLHASASFDLIGLHCHIGSQIFETTGFKLAARRIMDKLVEWHQTLGFDSQVLNLGGGFGVRYTAEDEPLEPSEYVRQIIEEVRDVASTNAIAIPEIWIEPGRSLVGEAGTTLYKVGSRKEVPGIRNYVAVDGGMSDNIRPALYDAHYDAVLAASPEKIPEETVAIAGKCCESGDMLIWDLPLPKSNAGEVLAVFCTGAYGYAMASNYNRIPRPPVVFVENGIDKLIVARETYENLVQNDLPL
ncbi:diaminopimelate decarboxylase [Listeria ivanovii]|uniref:Diaminopimelate decarboxylase n=1 Tax=Listeria ivanovii (strain ATCC BAA-678 / PAM 55) TaxID=881621 RepID=G2ZCN9_LISIP|nr:diaminopimelate decarboxylase [Listeria ivanovii]AHI56465.1 diaminopimelate decarboxylase [Listeria ivanovii WSLC3009]AIS65888.1 diaminopimelate decarboxylase [Listeria ivanovii subsp. ivanovii]MBC1759076.1 diaminopimelate decarboxylase [Listeria ivanovii]MBK3914100.1 diaminopimelate decarboxylase [Listeria ivanovii subsp. ivanovii]MBK3921062.1 diaminopimelate decarboxylase [Listeria ivanovii subsp. ivanovii]